MWNRIISRLYFTNEQMMQRIGNKQIFEEWLSATRTQNNKQKTISSMQQIMQNDKLSLNGKLDFFLKMMHHQTNYAWFLKDYLVKQYQQNNLTPGQAWKLNLLAFYCIEQNANGDLTNLFKTMIKLGLQGTSIETLLFLTNVNSRNYKMPDLFSVALWNSIRESLTNSSFWIKSIETLYDLTYAVKVLYKNNQSEIADIILTKNIIPYLYKSHFSSNKAKFNNRFKVFLNMIYPVNKPIISKLIQNNRFDTELEQYYYLCLFNKDYKPILSEHHMLQTTSKHTDFAFDVYYETLCKVKEAEDVSDLYIFSEIGQFDHIIKSFIKENTDFLKYQIIISHKEDRYAKTIEMHHILEALNAIKENRQKLTRKQLLIILPGITNLLRKRWGDFNIDNLLQIREAYLEIEGNAAEFTEDIEALIRRYIGCLTNLLMPNILLSNAIDK